MPGLINITDSRGRPIRRTGGGIGTSDLNLRITEPALTRRGVDPVTGAPAIRMRIPPAPNAPAGSTNIKLPLANYEPIPAPLGLGAINSMGSGPQGIPRVASEATSLPTTPEKSRAIPPTPQPKPSMRLPNAPPRKPGTRLAGGIGSDQLVAAAPTATGGGIGAAIKAAQPLAEDLSVFGGALAAGESPFFGTNFGNALLSLTANRQARRKAETEAAAARATAKHESRKQTEVERAAKVEEQINTENAKTKRLNSKTQEKYVDAQIKQFGKEKVSKVVDTPAGVAIILKDGTAKLATIKDKDGNVRTVPSFDKSKIDFQTKQAIATYEAVLEAKLEEDFGADPEGAVKAAIKAASEVSGGSDQAVGTSVPRVAPNADGELEFIPVD